MVSSILPRISFSRNEQDSCTINTFLVGKIGFTKSTLGRKMKKTLLTLSLLLSFSAFAAGPYHVMFASGGCIGNMSEAEYDAILGMFPVASGGMGECGSEAQVPDSGEEIMITIKVETYSDVDHAVLLLREHGIESNLVLINKADKK
jgi:hypothetical protein